MIPLDDDPEGDMELEIEVVPTHTSAGIVDTVLVCSQSAGAFPYVAYLTEEGAATCEGVCYEIPLHRT